MLIINNQTKILHIFINVFETDSEKVLAFSGSKRYCRMILQNFLLNYCTNLNYNLK